MINLTSEKTLSNCIYCLLFEFLIMHYIGNMTDFFDIPWKYKCNRLKILTFGKFKIIKALVETIVLTRSFTIEE